MVYITKEEWDRIPQDYKGIWKKELKENGWQPDLPEKWIGRRTVLEA